jgi:hypothetical protein
MSRITLQHALAAGLAASVLAAAPAAAHQVDRVDRYDSPTSSLAGTVTPHQDLRGEMALDAARAAEGTAHVYVPPQQPATMRAVRPPAAVKAVSAPKTTGDDDVWLILGIALGTTGIVAGSSVAVTRRARLRARRAIA